MTDWVVVAGLTLVMVVSLAARHNNRYVDSPLSTEDSRRLQVFHRLAVGPFGAAGNTLKPATTADHFGRRLLAALAGVDIQLVAEPAPRATQEEKEGEGAEATDGPPSSQPRNPLDLSGTDLSRQALVGRNWSGAILADADLSYSDLSRSNLSGAVAIRARFRSANLTRATIMSAILTDADLTEADLSWANVSATNFNGARLTNAILIGVAWTRNTVWPGDIVEDVIRRSVQIDVDTFQILPVDSHNRIMA